MEFPPFLRIIPLVLLLFLIGTAVFFGRRRSKEWKRENPGKLSFTWGYTFGYLSLFSGVGVIFASIIVGIGIAIASFFNLPPMIELPLFFPVVLFILFAPNVLLAYFVLQRSRWAFVALTAVGDLSLLVERPNLDWRIFLFFLLLLWITNGIYMMNRWEEFKSEVA